MRDKIGEVYRLERIATLIPKEYLYPVVKVSGGNYLEAMEDPRLMPYYHPMYPFEPQELLAGEIGIIKDLRIVFI